MAEAELLARQQAEGHKALLLLETEFNAKPRTAVLSIQGSQIRALAQFPSFFQTYPSPVILNAAILKLADWFHHGNNVVRMHIYKVLAGVSKENLTKIINVDETIRRIIPVLGSNDPTARALTLRVLGCMAAVFKDNLDVQHGLLQSILQSTDRFETEAAVWASDQYCSYSVSFLSVMFMRIQMKLNDPSTSFGIQLELVKILRHMHSDIAMARQAKQLCLKLLDQHSTNERLVIVALRTLTKLLSVALIDQREQIDRLLVYMLHDTRLSVQQSVLHDLQHLSRTGIKLDAKHITTLLTGIAASTVTSPRFQQSAYKCAEMLVRLNHTLINHILQQPEALIERHLLLKALETWQAKLATLMQQQQYSLAQGCAQLLVAIAEIPAMMTTGEELHDSMYVERCIEGSLFYDRHTLLQQVADHIFQIPLSHFYTACQQGQHSTRKLKKLMGIRSKLLLLLNNQVEKDTFMEGFNMMIEYPDHRLGSITLRYCVSIADICRDFSSWFPRLALNSLEDHIHSPVTFINVIRLLFRTIQADRDTEHDILSLLRLFGGWNDSTGKYSSNGWHLYLIGKEAGLCGWYFVMHFVMNDLQSNIESDGCMYWLASLSLLGSAEWSLTRAKDGSSEKSKTGIANLHVAALTKLKAFHAITGRSKFQSWFLRLRMEFVYAVQRMLNVATYIRHAGMDENRTCRMMNDCANLFQLLASRYDHASQAMIGGDKAMLTIMEVYRISALVLEYASRICVKLSDTRSFFCIDPTLLSLILRKDRSPGMITAGSNSISTRLQTLRRICISVLKEMVKWEEEENAQDIVEKHYLNVIETFCQTLLQHSLVLPSFFFHLI